MLFFLEGKKIKILKPIKKEGKVLLESEEYIFLETSERVEKLKKEELIIELREKNKIFYIKFKNIPNLKQRIKKLKKYLS